MNDPYITQVLKDGEWRMFHPYVYPRYIAVRVIAEARANDLGKREYRILPYER